jgi:hypothetical protein
MPPPPVSPASSEFLRREFSKKQFMLGSFPSEKYCKTDKKVYSSIRQKPKTPIKQVETGSKIRKKGESGLWLLKSVMHP